MKATTEHAIEIGLSAFDAAVDEGRDQQNGGHAVTNETALPPEVAIALAIYDVVTLEGLMKISSAIAATDDPAEVEALLRAWSRQVQIDAQWFFVETLEQICAGRLIH